MQMQEYVEQIAFMLGLPSNSNVESTQIEQAVTIAFRELQRYMRTSTVKTVPFATRLDLPQIGIDTYKVLNVQAAYPRLGLTLSSIESGNVFQVAASVNVYGTLNQGQLINIDPIVRESALAQVRNCLSTDFQWTYDLPNQCLYCTHKDPKPAAITIRYVPACKDVSEIVNPMYIDYLVRMGTANMKIALGRSRSKYRIEGSNVSLDGDTLLAEGNAELETMRQELESKSSKLGMLN